jgi:hypothetical protein
MNGNSFSEFAFCYVRAEVRTDEHGEDNGRSFATLLNISNSACLYRANKHSLRNRRKDNFWNLVK